MRGGVVASMCQKLPWGKTWVCGVCEGVEVCMPVRKLSYGEILHVLRSVLILTWNADPWFVGTWGQKGGIPLSQLRSCLKASSLLSLWHLHQKTLDLGGSLRIPASSQPWWASPWEGSAAWGLAKSSPVTAVRDGSALVCAKSEMRRTHTHPTRLLLVTGAVTGGSCMLSPRFLICYHSFAFSCFQENSLTLFRRGRRETTHIKSHGNSLCAAFNIYLQHQNSWIYKLLSAAICKTLKRLHRGEEPSLRWGE